MINTITPSSEIWIGDVACPTCSEKTSLSIPRTQLEIIDGKEWLPSFITMQAFCSEEHTLCAAFPPRGSAHNSYSQHRYNDRLESKDMYINTMNASDWQHE